MADTDAPAPEPVSKALDGYTDSSLGWVIADLPTKAYFRDVGSYGLRQFGGWVREEFLPQLQGRQAARVYREMGDNSSIVGAIIFAITQSMRKVDWRTIPADDTPEAQEGAEFADSVRHDMSSTWSDFIAEAFSMLQYGYAPHEIVYKKRNGPQGADSPVPNSLYNDGKIGLRRLPIRGQDTVIKWFFDENGQIKGVTQQPWIGPLIDLPIQKMLLFRPTAHKNNPEGRSVLRNAYRSWYFIKRMEEQEAILFERMSGLPVIYLPSAVLQAASSGDANAKAALAAYQKIVTNVRVDEQMGVLLPSDRWMSKDGIPTNERMYEMQLLAPQGRMRVDSNAVIDRYKLDILYTVLADFIQLGHSARGTQNLALSKVDMFFQAIEGWLNSVAEVLNRYLLPRLWQINGMDLNTMPKFEPDMAQRVDLDSLGNFFLHTAQAGMMWFPDDDLEDWVRDAAGLPEISDEGDVEGGAQLALGGSADAESIKKAFRAFVARRVRKDRLNGKAPKP